MINIELLSHSCQCLHTKMIYTDKSIKLSNRKQDLICDKFKFDFNLTNFDVSTSRTTP